METDVEPASSWAPDDRIEFAVRAGPCAPAAARTLLSDWVSGRIPDGLVDDVRLLQTELVTNCLAHGGLAADATIRISVLLSRRSLRLEVCDPGRIGTVTPRAPNSVAGGGYGLHLVEMIASRWGIDRTEGTRVWFELALAVSGHDGGPSPAAPRPQPSGSAPG